MTSRENGEGTGRTWLARAGAAAGALLWLGGSALAQQAGAPATVASAEEGASFGGYPARVLTIESGRLLDPGGTIGLGDTRWSAPSVLLELYTDTIEDALGIANLGVKLGLVEGSGARPDVAVGARGYWSYGGLIDVGVRKAVESFADVTESEVDLSGVTGHATATWSVLGGRTRVHGSVQGHHPIESKFLVQDSEAGGGGSVEFLDGDDVSAMAGLDHRLAGGAVILLAEGGYSWGLERARFGAGLDVGSRHWRVLLGAFYPGVETDLATDARDFVVTPEFSLHYRF